MNKFNLSQYEKDSLTYVLRKYKKTNIPALIDASSVVLKMLTIDEIPLFTLCTYTGCIDRVIKELDKEVAATASNINLKDSEEDIREAIDKYDFACTCYKAADKMCKSISTLETTELE